LDDVGALRDSIEIATRELILRGYPAFHLLPLVVFQPTVVVGNVDAG
jgi:hypothetical protein